MRTKRDNVKWSKEYTSHKSGASQFFGHMAFPQLLSEPLTKYQIRMQARDTRHFSYTKIPLHQPEYSDSLQIWWFPKCQIHFFGLFVSNVKLRFIDSRQRVIIWGGYRINIAHNLDKTGRIWHAGTWTCAHTHKHTPANTHRTYEGLTPRSVFTHARPPKTRPTTCLSLMVFALRTPWLKNGLLF